MQRGTSKLTLTALVMSLWVMSGCEDQTQRITLLEEENRTLYQDLESLRGQIDLLKQQRDRCQEDLLASQQRNSSLQAQLTAKPAPVPVQMPGEWQAVPGGAMLAIPVSVLFNSGKVDLRKESKRVLAQVASEINSEFADKDIYVFGHTDNEPIKKSGWKDNRQLSTERALAVVRFLQSQGVAPGRLSACGWGEHRPVASNASRDGKARNRRVELFAVDPDILASK